MVNVKHIKKETSITLLEAKIEDKNYQFLVDHDAPLGDCLIALDQIYDHIESILKNIESQEKQKSEAENV